MAGNGLGVASESGEQPVTGTTGIGHRLKRREGLGGDDEERLRGIKIMHGFGKIGAIYIGDEAQGQRAVAVMTKSLIGHDRTEVRSTDPDIEDILDPLAGESLPLTASDAIGKGAHRIENRMHLWHDILTIDLDHFTLRSTESDMEHGTVLGGIDFLPRKHRITMRLEP